jgi:GNAT superfamily N-acetyltransferase
MQSLKHWAVSIWALSIDMILEIPASMATPTSILRSVRAEDELFLRQLYASTRADELALTGWTAEQQDAFLQMQFNAQRQYYREQFPAAEYHIIQCAGTDVGRLIVWRAAGEMLLMDIALLPEYRNHGVGTALIKDLMAEAAQTGRPLRLHVECFNPALRLYDRLGFAKLGETGLYYEMEWRPAGTGSDG